MTESSSKRLRRVRTTLAMSALGALITSAGVVAQTGSAQAAEPGSLPAGCTQETAGGTVTCTFAYTGGEQTFTVPPGVSEVTATVWGGTGAAPLISQPPSNGYGGLLQGTFGVESGAEIAVVVGRDGHQGTTPAYGFGYGAGAATASGGGGAGGSGVAVGDDVMIVAGGGGGAGFHRNCGDSLILGGGGGHADQNGEPGAVCPGGTTSAAGGVSGAAPGRDGTAPWGNSTNGGGGGGGYVGGTGGQAIFGTTTTAGAGGGGGRSHAAPGVDLAFATLTDRQFGQHGQVTISYEPAVAASLVLSPASASVTLGAGQAYTVASFAADGASLGDVTDASTLSISPDGSCTGAVCTPASAGPHTVTASYGDLTATASLEAVPPPVEYDFGGFQTPIDAQPTVNKAKAGSSIPVKFSLGGDYGLDVLVDGVPVSQATDCGSGAQDAIEQTVSGNKQGLTYNAATDTYTYIWSTDKNWSGTCRTLVLNLADGSTQQASFSFK